MASAFETLGGRSKTMRRRDGERGHVLVTVALVLFVLIGFAVLTVDIGVASSARTEAQRAADAAALAGAFEFVTNPNLTGQALTDAITSSAKNTAAQNTIQGAAVPTSDVTVSIDTANRRVTVTLSHSTPTFFAGIFGRSTMTIGATGIAEAAASATGDLCVSPWFIPNTALATDSNICDTTNGKSGKVTPGAYTDGQFMVDPTTKVETQYAFNWIAAHPSRQFGIKPNNPGNAIAPGDFMAIQLPDSKGGHDYRQNIATCPASAIACANAYSAQTGNDIGNTRKGVCERITYDQDQNCTGSVDTWVGVGQYLEPSGKTSNTSRSLSVAPIVDVCSFTPCGVASGTNVTFPVIGFAFIFIDGLGNCPNGGGQCVLARLINVSGCGSGNGGSSGLPTTETGPFGLPVRLVRTQ